MAIDALVAPLLRVPLFHGLKPLQISEIARRAHRIVYQPGDVIMAAHAETDGAVLIVSGHAVRTSGPGVGTEPESVPVGSILSEMSMLIETESASTIVAETQVRAMRIVRAEMLEIMGADPSVADHFIDRISGRLSEFVAGLREIDQALEHVTDEMPVSSSVDIAPPPAGIAGPGPVASLH